MKTVIKIDVDFRVFVDGDIIALFPNDAWDDVNIASYMHIGQHGGASKEHLNELTKASQAQYAELETELISIGYKLNILK